ncbi:MAG: serine/threonine protein kinase [Deltaproteobacteria bacterium]|nr:serine/threonine protein kinase [Deltaproteobacteria bacterium]
MTVATYVCDPASDPRLGTLFEGRYRIDAPLGRGGFGAVYRATQIGVERPVALKILDARHLADRDESARFEQEARIVANLDHPHVVRLYEAGRAATGELFLVMELVVGESLARRVRRDGPLADADVVRFGRQILGALVEAHAHGVVHRDLKTENLQVTRHPRRGDIVKLLDFGIAKAPSISSGSAPRTRAGLIVGTPKILAPEQICRDPVTPRTDLYAFGCVVYELLTGRPPFVCRSAGAYARAHLSETPAWPVRRGELLAGPLVELVMQCLEKRPEDRPPSAEALLAVWPREASAITASPTRAHPTPPPPLPSLSPEGPDAPTITVRRRPSGRRRAARAWIAAALALVAAALAWTVGHAPGG